VTSNQYGEMLYEKYNDLNSEFALMFSKTDKEL
jgi:hypothetical protein